MQRIIRIIHMQLNYFEQAGVKTEKVEIKKPIDVYGKQKHDFVDSLLQQLEETGLE